MGAPRRPDADEEEEELSEGEREKQKEQQELYRMRQTVQAALGGDYQRMNSNKKKEEAEDAKLEMQMREIRQERVVTTRVVTSMLDKKKVVMHENVSVKQTYQKNNNVV